MVNHKNQSKGELAKPQAAEAAVEWVVFVGLMFLGVATAASVMLAVHHIRNVQMPGCGIGTACDEAARSLWSLIGAGYFAALSVALLVRFGRFEPAFVWIVRLGVAISLTFLGVMLFTKHWCAYCAATHAANLAFWIVVEVLNRKWKQQSPAIRGFPATAIFAFALALGGLALGGAEIAQRKSAADIAKREHDESVKQMIGRSASTAPASTQQSIPSGPPFTGRYRVGPENAPIRIVIISDYQCHDCKGIEAQVKQLLATRQDISVSAKQHPMCPDCNKYMNGQKMHDNACWAARAAEAAGILRGNDGFWQMHSWLFDQNGSFTDQTFPNSLRQLGYDPQQFITVMSGSEALDRVKADIDEGQQLGLHFTPMIFINGVELRGVRTPNSLINAVQSLAAANPPPGTAAQDHPSPALDKYVGDWRDQRPVDIPPDTQKWPLGPDSARVKIVMFSNYQFNMSPELDGLIRAAMKGRADVQYTFRQFPIDQTCNPEAEMTSFPKDCLASRAAEAAGMLGGAEAFWKMHDWLLKNPAQLSEDALRQAAPSMGLNVDALFTTMSSPQVQNAIAEDARACKFVMNKNMYQGIPQGIPLLFINNKWVPRWQLEGRRVIDRILEEASR